MIRSFIMVCIVSAMAWSQVSGDQLEFQKIMSLPNDSAKLSAIDSFIAQHPSSSMLPNAYAVRFQVCVNLKKDSAAFVSVRNYLKLMDPSRLVQALHAVAFELAQRKYFVDSALVFIDSAIALHQNEEPVLLNTKALALLRLKRIAEAESVQQQTIALFPENAEFDGRFVSFFVQYGFIQMESGKTRDGMQRIVLANIVLPKQSLPIRVIDSMLVVNGIAEAAAAGVRDSLYEAAIARYLSVSADAAKTKSNIAVGLARNGVLTDVALAYALEAHEAAQSRNIEERSGAAAALGLTYFYLQRLTDAERYLLEATAVASPTESELFSTLGEVEERLGKKRRAFDSYVLASMTSRSSSLYQRLIELKNELFPTGNLDSIIVARQAAAIQFSPEEYKRPKRELSNNEYHRVVLAELFTGSECKPCQAADIAFDYLIERYNAASLAILEYHLHIPLPDPLSNLSAEERGAFYGVNSTPTAIINGTDVVTSGGNRLMAKSKFYLYADLIERQLQLPTTVSLSAAATMSGDKIDVTVKGISAGKSDKLKLHIALAEDEVLYKGANGIENHKFVVRKMITPGEGIAVQKNGKIDLKRSVSLSAVVKELEEYFVATNERFSDLGAELKEKKSAIDRSRLAVVAFVQNSESREILQAVTEKVRAVAETKKGTAPKKK